MLENGLESTNCFVTQCLDLNIRFLRFPQTVSEPPERSCRPWCSVPVHATTKKRWRGVFAVKARQMFSVHGHFGFFFFKNLRNREIKWLSWFHGFTSTRKHKAGVLNTLLFLNLICFLEEATFLSLSMRPSTKVSHNLFFRATASASTVMKRASL